MSRSNPGSEDRSKRTRSERLRKEIAVYSSELAERLIARRGEPREVTIDDEKIDRQLAHPLGSSARRRRSRREAELEQKHAVLRAKLAKLFQEREDKPGEAVILGERVEYQLVVPLNT